MAFRYGLQQWTRQLTKKQPEIIQLAADKEIAQMESVRPLIRNGIKPYQSGKEMTGIMAVNIP
jgi:hypothetical protein